MWRVPKRFLVPLVPALRGIGSLFYDSRYLRGRHFDETSIGWRWLLRGILFQKILGFNRHIPWPVSPFMIVSPPAENIAFDPDDLNNFQTVGCYFQCYGGRISIGRGTYIAPNVGLITTNHDPLDPDLHLPPADIRIGEKCWIGMNAVILPGVELGPHTVVGAGAVVNRSFPEGYCVVGGVPAKLIKNLRSGEDASSRSADACQAPVKCS